MMGILEPTKLNKLLVAGFALTLGAISLSSWLSDREIKPLNTSPTLGSKLEMIQPNAFLGGVHLKAYDSDKERFVHFYDYGFDGTLDEVMVNKGGVPSYSTYNPSELKKWEPSYEKLREMSTNGEFKPIFEEK